MNPHSSWYSIPLKASALITYPKIAFLQDYLPKTGRIFCSFYSNPIECKQTLTENRCPQTSFEVKIER